MCSPGASAWGTRCAENARRLARFVSLAQGRVLLAGRMLEALEAVLTPGDWVVPEGDNQKQADFLSRSLLDGTASLQ
jgi:malonate decarboxylase alpha subunit